MTVLAHLPSPVIWPSDIIDMTCSLFVHCYRASPQQSRGFFGGSKGTFTSFFSRTGHSAGASPGGDASIHGGAAGHFRQVNLLCMSCELQLQSVLPSRLAALPAA